jgi:hypothetical protein
MSLGLGENQAVSQPVPSEFAFRISHFVVEVVPLCFNETDLLFIELDCLPLGRSARRHGH